ncbi:hypothetical protein [Streptomyces cavernicola]|uniref:Uncharacterized protein n=1 Tax=Streptomyces cavernicola TaxID=3043613 RepID=A0ABT6SJD0_9ACTN|nr:hypothetical protein [Streptomyces sp. B-S-A6]MDI3408004.1 hypothetical protein [Streptomyces sp. B-S-A6]
MKLRRTALFCVAVSVGTGAVLWAVPTAAATAVTCALTLAVGAGMVALGRHGRPPGQRG